MSENPPLLLKVCPRKTETKPSPRIQSERLLVLLALLLEIQSAVALAKPTDPQLAPQTEMWSGTA